MKSLVTIFLFLASFNSNAQNSYNFYFDWDARLLNENPLSEDMRGVVKEVKIKRTFPKEKNNNSVQKNYDENGFVTFYEVNNRAGELKQKSEAQYNAKGNVTLYRRYSEKGIQREKINAYDDQLRITETVIKNGKGKISQRSTWVYGTGQCATASTLYKKGGQKINKIWNYYHYKDCDPSKTTITNSKGKIIKTWTYDCKKEGEQLTKKKDETQVCKWEESDGKYLTRVFQNFDEKGRVTKTVQKYTIADTLILSLITYNGEDKIQYKITYDQSFDRQTSYVSYDKTGKEKYRNESLFSNHKMQSRVILSKGKKISETFYSYNDKGWLVKIESFDKKDKKTRREDYEYVL